MIDYSKPKIIRLFLYVVNNNLLKTAKCRKGQKILITLKIEQIIFKTGMGSISIIILIIALCIIQFFHWI